MRKGSKGAPYDDGNSQTHSAALQSGLAVVLNVLSHGKAKCHQRSIHNSVDHPVELISFPEENHKEDESLGAFLDDWSEDHSRRRLARAHAVGYGGGNGKAQRVKNDRYEDRYQRAPAEGRREQPHWLRFISIDP